MLQRLTEVFWPPKWKAALGAIFCFVLAILLYSTGTLALFGTCALIYGLWYAFVWLYKFSRDKQLAAQAQTHAMQQHQQAQQITPFRTTSESSQLFVPPQLPDEH